MMIWYWSADHILSLFKIPPFSKILVQVYGSKTTRRIGPYQRINKRDDVHKNSLSSIPKPSEKSRELWKSYTEWWFASTPLGTGRPPHPRLATHVAPRGRARDIQTQASGSSITAKLSPCSVSHHKNATCARHIARYPIPHELLSVYGLMAACSRFPVNPEIKFRRIIFRT